MIPDTFGLEEDINDHQRDNTFMYEKRDELSNQKPAN